MGGGRGEEGLELISRFEFDYRCCGKFFLNDSNSVQSSCAVDCLYPNNSISNVVSSVTIHDDMKNICTKFIRDLCIKHMEPSWKVEGFFNRTALKVSDVQIVRYAWVLVAKDISNHPVAGSRRSVPQESWS